jgi:hypothetical protein
MFEALFSPRRGRNVTIIFPILADIGIVPGAISLTRQVIAWILGGERIHFELLFGGRGPSTSTTHPIACTRVGLGNGKKSNIAYLHYQKCFI